MMKFCHESAAKRNLPQKVVFTVSPRL